MIHYKIDFGSMPWEDPFGGVRHKVLDQKNLRMRLVEYSKEMPPHWCDRGHYGYLLEGEMEITCADETIRYGPGDGIFLPDGAKHRHRAVVLSDRAVVFFVERL